MGLRVKVKTMTSFLIFIVVIVIVVIGFSKLRGGYNGVNGQKKYQYTKKIFFLSRAEHECFDALMLAVGNDYYVFAQVHLPTLVDGKIVGQNWRGAFRHISEKSVDFVLCDKAYLSPKLAIELDDRTHERLERKEQDREVERILKDAKVPLLRLENHGRFNSSELSRKIKDALASQFV